MTTATSPEEETSYSDEQQWNCDSNADTNPYTAMVCA
jgi:hypothetical protein